jgi:hypothetical protein
MIWEAIWKGNGKGNGKRNGSGRGEMCYEEYKILVFLERM